MLIFCSQFYIGIHVILFTVLLLVVCCLVVSKDKWSNPYLLSLRFQSTHTCWIRKNGSRKVLVWQDPAGCSLYQAQQILTYKWMTMLPMEKPLEARGALLPTPLEGILRAVKAACTSSKYESAYEMVWRTLWQKVFLKKRFEFIHKFYLYSQNTVAWTDSTQMPP